MDNNRHFGSNSVDFVDSDDEDVSESLSPSDGYFSQASHIPQQILVPEEDPEASRSKAREAAQDSSTQRYRTITPPISSPTFTRNTIYTPSTSSGDRGSSSDIGEEISSPSQIPEDPPPLYETAIAAGRQRNVTQSASETSPLSPRHSPTYSTMGRANEFPHPFRDDPQAPQSMADNPGDMYNDEEAATRSNRGGGWFNEKTSGGRFRKFLVTMVWVILAILILLSLTGKVKVDTHHRSGPENGHVVPLPDTTRSRLPTATSSQPPPLPTSSRGPTVPPPNPPPYTSPPPVREIRIIETSKSVTGKFTLQDSIFIRTTSGSVTVTIVIPEDWNDSKNESSVSIASKDGSVHIDFVDIHGRTIGKDGNLPSTFFPNDRFEPNNQNLASDSNPTNKDKIRPLNMRFSSSSGSISGNYLHGDNTYFDTRSGSLSGTIRPLTSTTSQLSTKTESGSQTLTVTDPLRLHSRSSSSSSSSSTTFPSRPSLANLHATHLSVGSGSLTYTYPPSWTGGLHITRLGSGSVTATGPGLTISQYTSHHVIGSRGDGEGRVQIRQEGSGSVYFRCQGDGWWDWNTAVQQRGGAGGGAEFVDGGNGDEGGLRGGMWKWGKLMGR